MLSFGNMMARISDAVEVLMPPLLSMLPLMTLKISHGFVIACNDSELKDADRAEALLRHNIYRSNLAQGIAGYGAPGGNNVYELAYDCDLENSAQEWANKCLYLTHSHYKDIGENIYVTSNNKSNGKYLAAAAELWWHELAANGFQGATYTANYSGKVGTLGHWSQMAWGKTSKLGCGVAKCQFGTNVVCQYQRQGNIIGMPIYEIGGSGCSENEDCLSRTCNSSDGLCRLMGPLCEDKFINCKSLKQYCGALSNPQIDKGCPETCGLCAHLITAQQTRNSSI